jgi:hypothetical protein
MNISRYASHSHKANTNPLTDDDIARLAPSVFAATPHDSRSSRYAMIPTSDVLAGLRREGFVPFAAQQGLSRVPGKAAYTKHLLRLRHVDALAKPAAVGDSVNEILVLNSHDGTSAYKMMAGCFRFVCANGLVVGSIVDDVRVAHTGTVVRDVIEGAHRILGQFGAVDSSRDAMQTMRLSDGEARIFAEAALAVRYPDAIEAEGAPVTVEQVLRPRRYEDQDPSLWATFNRVQETLVGGGVRGPRRNGRRMTSRAVNGIDGNVALNRGLWILAERMRELRAAA